MATFFRTENEHSASPKGIIFPRQVNRLTVLL